MHMTHITCLLLPRPNGTCLLAFLWRDADSGKEGGYQIECATLAEAVQAAGGCHREPDGCVVEVQLHGQRIDATGQTIA